MAVTLPEPAPITTTSVTPSGLVIEFQAAPRRLYRIDGEEVPSVTTILEVLDKPALPWWGMKIGVAGVLELMQLDSVTVLEFRDAFGAIKHWLGDKDSGATLSVEDVVNLLTQHKLTVNHVRDQAGDRGANVHDAFERWSITGDFPAVEDFPLEERGYVEGLRKFLMDASLEPESSEVMVGSKRHGYAGRYDLRAVMTAPSKVVTKITESRQPRYTKTTTVPASRGLIDLKTSAGVYPSHYMQLEAYEEASIEGGYEPTDWRAVLHVTSDGYYEFKRSRATIEDFLAIRGAWAAYNRVSEAMKS